MNERLKFSCGENIRKKVRLPCTSKLFKRLKMRQRAAAHATHPTPPRSGDSAQWQEEKTKKQPRQQRKSYQLSLGQLIQDPSAVSKREVFRHNSGDGLVSRNIDSLSPIPGSSEGAAPRRRKTVSAYHKDETNHRMHSPQHHFTENSYNGYDNFQY